MGAETCEIVWIHRQIVSSDCVSSADSPLDRKCSVTLACLARPLEHVQLSTNGGGELSTAVTLLLSKFSSVDLRSTDVTLFT